MSRIDEIKAFAMRKEEEQNAKEIALSEKIEDYKSQIRALKPRIDELIETANVCLANGIKLHNQYWEYKDKLCTDKCSHIVGFVLKWYGETKVYLLGIDGGGCCGKYDFRTDGDKIYEEHEDTRERIEPTIYHLEKFLNGFDAFESKFYAYVDRVIKG